MPTLQDIWDAYSKGYIDFEGDFFDYVQENFAEFLAYTEDEILDFLTA